MSPDWDEKTRLQEEWERCSELFLAAKEALVHPTRSALIEEQRELQRTADEARLDYQRAYAAWKTCQKTNTPIE